MGVYMERKTVFDSVRESVNKCISSPIKLETVKERIEYLQEERKITSDLEKLYTLNSKQLLKQFSL